MYYFKQWLWAYIVLELYSVEPRALGNYSELSFLCTLVHKQEFRGCWFSPAGYLLWMLSVCQHCMWQRDWCQTAYITSSESSTAGHRIWYRSCSLYQLLPGTDQHQKARSNESCLSVTKHTGKGPFHTELSGRRHCSLPQLPFPDPPT